MDFLIGTLIVLFLTWCFWRIGVNIICEYDGTPKIAVKVLFVKIKILPKKPPKAKFKKLSKKAYEKKKAVYDEKQRKKAEKKALKAEAKKKKKAEQREKKKLEKASLTKEAKKLKKDELVETITFFAKVGTKLLKKFGSRLYINVKKMNIVVASKDAATTAIMYGGISQSVAYLFKALDRAIHFKCKKEEFSLKCDFTSEKIRADVCIVFRVRLWHVLALGASAGVRFLKLKMKQKKRRKSQNVSQNSVQNSETQNNENNKSDNIKENNQNERQQA